MSIYNKIQIKFGSNDNDETFLIPWPYAVYDNKESLVLDILLYTASYSAPMHNISSHQSIIMWPRPRISIVSDSSQPIVNALSLHLSQILRYWLRKNMDMPLANGILSKEPHARHELSMFMWEALRLIDLHWTEVKDEFNQEEGK